jgi:hypothetical protein
MVPSLTCGVPSLRLSLEIMARVQVVQQREDHEDVIGS